MGRGLDLLSGKGYAGVMEKRTEQAGKRALDNLAYELGITENARIMIDAGDLEDLVKYARELQELTEREFRVGDTVEALASVVGIQKGEVGRIIAIAPENVTHYPYTVSTGGILNGQFAKSELKRVWK